MHKRRSFHFIHWAVMAIAIFLWPICAQDAYGWGVMPPSATHQHILREAYGLLQADPAFDGKKFPSLDAILSHEGVNWVNINWTGEGATGLDVSKIEGPGPDSKGNSPFSWHYYNPATGEGSAPAAVKRFYRYLAEGMLSGKKEALPKSAAWSAHFLADMYCIYHVNGMTRATAEAIYKNQAGGLVNTGRITLGDDLKGSVKLSYLTPIKGYSNNFHTELIRFLKTGEDWFDPWYFNGNTETMMSNMSSHIAWESTINPTTYDLHGFSPGWKNGPKSFEKALDERSNEAAKLAMEAAALTRSKIDYLFDNPQMAVNHAVRSVYTMWRSSFSALTPGIDATEDGDVIIVTGKASNRGGTALENTEVRLTVDGCTLLTEQKLMTLGKLMPGDFKKTDPWRAKKGDGPCRLTLEAIADAPVPDLQYARVQSEIGPSLIIKPAKATISKAAKQQFRAYFQGKELRDVIWSVKQGSSGGSVTESGLYNPPEGGGSFTVVARGKADAKLVAEASVVVPGIFLETTITIGAPNTHLPFTVKATHPPQKPFYGWDFGDGTVIDKTDQTTVSHLYRAKGDYRITVTLTDSATGTLIDRASGTAKIDDSGQGPGTMTARLYCYEPKTQIEREYDYYKKEGKEMLHGKFLLYHCKNGRVASKGQYRDDQPVGIAESFNEDGDRIGLNDYSTGMMEAFDYYDNRQLKSHRRTKDGKKHGLQETFSRTGTKTSEVLYEADQPSGIYALWWNNGNPASTGFYKIIKRSQGYPDSVKHGAFKEYSENGKLLREENYVDGERKGMFRRYYKNGHLAEEGEYKDGRNKTGVWRYYYESGAKKRQEVGERRPQGYGVIHYDGVIEWDESGKEIFKQGIYK